MTPAEEELSKKLLHTQSLSLQTIEIVMVQAKEIDDLKLRMDKLGTEFEAYCIANPRKMTS